MKRSILNLSLLIFLFAVISCEESEPVDGGCQDAPVHFQIDIANNTEHKVSVEIFPVHFGTPDYDENIYVNKEEYDREFYHRLEPLYSNVTEYLLDAGYGEYVSGSNVYYFRNKNKRDWWYGENGYVDKQINAKDSCKEIEFWVCSVSLDSILMEIKFESGEVRRLVGWPKYFNDKLDDVVKYGFFYNVDSDKNVYLYNGNWNGEYIEGYFFDESENIAGGYFAVYYYPVTIVINSVDDIKLEISETEIDKPNEKKILIAR